MVGSSDFPSMDVKKLRKLLAGLGYKSAGGGKGSYEKLVSDHYPSLIFSGHTGKEIAGGLVKKILRKDVGLSIEEAKEVLRGKFRTNDHN